MDSALEREPEVARTVWTSAGFVVLLALAILIGLFWETAWGLVGKWLADSTYGHGLLVAPVSAALVWMRRDRLLRLTPRACPWGLLLVALAALMWLVGNLGGVQTVQQFALVAMIQALVLSVLGPAVVRALLFPLAFLYFAVPFGDFLITPLQELTAVAVVPLVRLSGTPIYLDGLYIFIPAGVFEVAEACAGLRFLISTVMLGALLSNLFYRSLRGRVLILLAAFAIPIVANALRAYGIVMIGQLAGMEYAAGTDHLVYGFIFLAFVTLLLLAVAYRFRETAPGEEASAPTPASNRATAPPRLPAAPLRLLAPGLAALVIAGAAPVYASWVTGEGASESPRQMAAPSPGDPWRETDGIAAWQPRFVGHQAEAQQAYAREAQRVDLRVFYYDRQRQGAEIVNTQNRLFRDWQGWLMSKGRAQLRVDGQDLEAHTQRWSKTPGNLLLVYWYWVDGRFVSDPRAAKLYEIKAKLLGGNQAAAVVAFAVPFEENRAEAIVALQDFLDHLGPLDAMLSAEAER